MFVSLSDELIEFIEKNCSNCRPIQENNKCYGFDGLRVDAVSQMHPTFRKFMHDYIRTRYPGLIIFEEVLFAQAKKLNVK